MSSAASTPAVAILHTMTTPPRELGAAEAASLDADEALLPFLPQLLGDLWALGVGPDPAIRLLKRNLGLFAAPRVLDLGCGKGALLIRLAKEFGWPGYGVDIIPEFIDEARCYAARDAVADVVEFEVNHMKVVVERGATAELVCFGYDSEALGPLPHALVRLRTCIAAQGSLLLEMSWARLEGDPDLPSEANVMAAARNAGYEVRDVERSEPEWVAAQEHANTVRIRRRAEALAREHPSRAAAFADYVREQEEESRRLVEEAVCVNVWLRPTAT